MYISTFLAFGQDSPNFLWLVCEDQSLFFSIYGDSTLTLQILISLAEDGIIYQNCYTPSPVCAPIEAVLLQECIPQHLVHIT